jgi:hypothetical protein
MSLKVNVGLSRKVSKDYQSRGFSLNVEGEVTSSTDDPQKLIEEIKHLYDVAEEALDQQIERTESNAAIGGHDAGRPEAPERRPAADNGRRAPSSNGNGQRDEAATNKQIQYLLSIGKRMKLSTAALESEIEQVLGQQVGLYDLTKKQAGIVIDSLTATTATSRA